MTGLFRTGGRAAHIFFDRIIVHNDGDSGFFLGAGDFSFYFGAGDVDTGENLGNAESYGPESISSREFRDVNCVVTVPQAPVGLWAQVFAEEDDRVLGAFGIEGPATSFAPPGSTCEDTVIGPAATVTQHFDFRELTNGIQEMPFQMSNGPCAIAFTVFGRLKVEAHPGVLLQPFIKRTDSAPRSPMLQVATLLGAGERVIVGTRSGIAHAVRLAPGGAVYGTKFSIKPAASGDRWTHIGGAFVGSMAAAVGPDGRIELFGLASDGCVFHRTLSAARSGEATSDWQIIGDGIGGSLTIFSSSCGDVSVVALGRQGVVLHKLRRGDDWWPAGREWQSLGIALTGPLSAELVEDDILILAVLAEDETIHLLPWHNYPGRLPSDGWRSVGTINSLLDARMSLIELPVDADESFPAAPAGSPQSTASPRPGSKGKGQGSINGGNA